MISLPDTLFVTRKWQPAVGGMETWSLRLSEELGRLGPLEVIGLPGRAAGLPPGPLALLRFPFTVARRYLARPQAPQILHLGDMALWPLGLLARLRRGPTRVILTSHGTDVSYPRRGGWKGHAYGAFLRIGARLMCGALVTTNSPATAKATASCGWRRITVIPLATEMTGMVPTTPAGRHILFVGRLVERKGCAWFIRYVLPLLPSDVELHVAGTKVDPLEAAALDHPRVRYLGVLHGKELAAAYREALCVVVPNIEPANGEFEGFGLVATEAAAAGGVVIAAQTGGLPAAVEDEVTGILVEPANPPCWRDAITRIRDWDLATRQSFVANALARIEQFYRWPRVAQDTLDAYVGALAKSD